MYVLVTEVNEVKTSVCVRDLARSAGTQTMRKTHMQGHTTYAVFACTQWAFLKGHLGSEAKKDRKIASHTLVCANQIVVTLVHIHACISVQVSLASAGVSAKTRAG